ncbi:MAG TPA: AI-2E family transporter [Pyrinomonadaceae bacterium]
MPAQEESKRNIQARWIALLFVTAVALYLCWLMLQPFLDVLLWALVLVIIFYPVHRRILARTGKPSLSALLSSVLVIVTILVPLSLVTLAVVREVAQLAQYLQANADTLLDPNSPQLSGLMSWLGQYIDVEQLRSQDFIAERLKNLSGTIAGRTLGFLGGFVGGLVQTFFVIFTMYYLFRDGERMRSALRFALPLERSQSNEIFHRTNEVIGASVYGVLVIATIQGTVGGLAFWLLGLPSALLWGAVMILLSMIPMLGAFLVWVPAALYLAVTGHWVKALILTLVGLFVIGTIDNFLRPKLVGEKTRLHELIIFFSVIGGLHVFGIIGLVLGPVIVAITLALLDVFRKADDPPHATTDEKTLLEEQEDLREVPPQPETG